MSLSNVVLAPLLSCLREENLWQLVRLYLEVVIGMHYFILARVFLAALLVAASCTVPTSSLHVAGPTSVATGMWGGEHMILQVSEKGGEAEFDCAHGRITQPMALDKRGNFDVAGTLTPEHGRPVRRNPRNWEAKTNHRGTGPQ